MHEGVDVEICNIQVLCSALCIFSIHVLVQDICTFFNIYFLQTIDYGPAAVRNVTTGPQPGSPNRVVDLQMVKTR